LSTWRGVKSVIVQDVANAVPTKSSWLDDYHNYLFYSMLCSE